MGAQHRIEKQLVTALRPFRAYGRSALAAMRAALEPGDFVPREAGGIKGRVRKIGGQAGGPHRIGDTPAAAEFHGAQIDGIGAWKIGAAVALFHQKTLDPAPAKLDGHGQPYRPAADNKNRYVDHYCARLQKFPDCMLPSLHRVSKTRKGQGRLIPLPTAPSCGAPARRRRGGGTRVLRWWCAWAWPVCGPTRESHPALHRPARRRRISPAR